MDRLPALAAAAPPSLPPPCHGCPPPFPSPSPLRLPLPLSLSLRLRRDFPVSALHGESGLVTRQQRRVHTTFNKMHPQLEMIPYLK